jgi:ABC-2 type transport system ATP-binding protein
MCTTIAEWEGFDAMSDATRTATSTAVIRTEELTKRYPGDILAVDSLDLTIEPGEIFGLLGPNGAGKTTTVGLLTTRIIPTSGRAFVAGVDVLAEPARAKQVIGVVPQTNTLDRSLSVVDNLYFHARYFGMGSREARRTANDLLERFRLADRADASVYALSGWMAQRLQVARAIAHAPRILFLDEPTAGLDPQSRLALWEILGELHKDGQTVLLTTHYMEEADRLCDRVAIMDHGRILALDTPAALKDSIDAETVVRLFTDGDADALAAELRPMEGVTNATASDGAVTVYVRGVAGALAQVVARAEEGGYQVKDLSVTEPTLETVFITLTGKDLRE